jgi:predicted RNase H-like HicB family nuclease
MKQHFIIDGEVFTASIWKEKNLFIAECPELEVTAQGRTIKSARTKLKEVSRMFLEETK